MANTSSRTLRLLSLLQTHRYWSGNELAERLEISVRTLRRDVDRLRELGYTVDAQRGIQGGYQLAAGVALPPLLLDDEEAVALAIGLRTAAQGAIAGVEDASVRALAKVQQVMPPQLRRRVNALRDATLQVVWNSGPTIDATTLTTIAQACRDEERLRFAYTNQAGEQTVRHVEPHRLVSFGRRWYLVAFDLGRQAWRSFRLDRLEQARCTEMRFSTRELPATDAAAFVRAGIGAMMPTQHVVETVFRAPAATVRPRIGRWVTVDEVDEQTCRMRVTVDNLAWALLAFAMADAEFEVLGPPELVDQLRDWGARFARSALASAASDSDDRRLGR